MTMTDTAEKLPSLFDMPALPKPETYVVIAGKSCKVLRYEDHHKIVVVEQWLQGTKHETKFPTSIFNPQPVEASPSAPEPVTARQAYEVVIEADTPEQVTLIERRLRNVLETEGIQTQALAAPAALTTPQWEIKILRQQIDAGDVDQHESTLAQLLNDGWEIIEMKSIRVKARFAAMLVVIYLKRLKAAELPVMEAVEAVENVPSEQPAVSGEDNTVTVVTVQPDAVTQTLPPAPVSRLDAHFIFEPERSPFLREKKPVDQVTFIEALQSGQYTEAELREIGNRQAMEAGRKEFVMRSLERQERMSMLDLPVLPMPDSYSA